MSFHGKSPQLSMPPLHRRLRRAPTRVLTALVMLGLAAHAVGQMQFDELRKRYLPRDRGAALGLASADFDRDGDPDLVWAWAWFGPNSAWAGSRRLHVNDGDGGFDDQTTVRLHAWDWPSSAVACCDADGDGDVDVVFAHPGSQDHLYFNDGQGRFTRSALLRGPRDHTTSIACADVDGDGDVDIVCGNEHDQDRLYLNDGAGTFTEAAGRLPAAVSTTNDVVFLDADGDGDDDLAFAIAGQNRLYLNDGNGVFTDVTAAQMPARNDASQAVCSGDVDGDGDPDLIFANSYQNRLYLNDGSGVFVDGPLPQDGDFTHAVAAADADGDGDLDLLFGNDGPDRLYLNDGAGTFTDATARLPGEALSTLGAVFTDVDGDGDADLVLATQYSRAFPSERVHRLYLNDGTGNFTDPSAVTRVPPRDPGATNEYTQALAIEDVDGDGDSDLVLGMMEDGMWFSFPAVDRLYLNDGTGAFTDVTATHMPPGAAIMTEAIVFCDVDGDHDRDLVSVGWDPGGEHIRLYLNDGLGRFGDVTAARLPAAAGQPRNIAVCDVDADGDFDLVFAAYGQDLLYLNDGSGTFQDATAARMPVDPLPSTAVLACDVDDDHDCDLVLATEYGQHRLYLNDGTGTFTEATAARMPAAPAFPKYPWGAACCDVDGDGDVDLVFGDGLLYLNDGKGFFTDATAGRIPIAVSYPACADIDLDGDIDLVGSGSLLVNDGTGRFDRAPQERFRGFGQTHACADVDGDGDGDVVFGKSNGATLQLNLLRQLDAPKLLRVGRRYELEVYARYGPASATDLAIVFLSCAPARIPLPPYGTVGIDPTCAVPLPAVVVPQPAGVATVWASVPNDPSLAGARIYAQAMVVQYPLQERLTNVTVDRMQD